MMRSHRRKNLPNIISLKGAAANGAPAQDISRTLNYQRIGVQPMGRKCQWTLYEAGKPNMAKPGVGYYTGAMNVELRT